MKKPQIIYIHGGEAFDQWLPGLKSVVLANLKNLYRHGTARWPDTLHCELPDFEIMKLKMPGKYNAKYDAWKKHFEAQFENFSDEVVLLGWSLGANFLAKYLSEEFFPKQIKAVHLVAGCYGCPGGFGLLEDFPGRLNSKPVFIYHSTDDFVVDFADSQKYKSALTEAEMQVFKDRNHFLQPEFPELISCLKKTTL